MKKVLGGVLLATVLTAMAGSAHAQVVTSATGNITASATVTGSLSGANVRQLDFGFVVPGSPKTVNYTDGTSGIVRFTGTPLAGVDIGFTVLPANLSDGTNSLPIAYNAATAPSLGGALTSFTPALSNNNTSTTLAAGTGLVFVYVGGTVTPDPAQVAGLYQGTITVRAAYNGN